MRRQTKKRQDCAGAERVVLAVFAVLVALAVFDVVVVDVLFAVVDVAASLAVAII